MREFKFRAWDKNNSCMYYSNDIGDDIIWTLDKDGICVHEQYQKVCPNTGVISYGWQKVETVIMQFTGLTDKNGKEIYEGDIVKIVQDYSIKYANKPEPSFPFDSIAKIDFDSVNAKFTLENDEEQTGIGYYAGWSGWNWLEIIGNIYSNPELLEAK